MKKATLVVLFVIQLLVSCQKQATSNDCGNLKDGITNNDIDKVRSTINSLILELPSQDYNTQNLSTLAQRISSQCGVFSEVVCFDCIYTLPSQSEINVQLNSSGSTTIERTIDITYATANTMTFRNMHD